MPSFLKFKNMMQPNGLHHPDYTEQMPNVKFGQTDLSSAGGVICLAGLKGI
jgi:hypothetical protein